LTLVNRSTVAARTLVLHVGIHKTASTYIQHRLKANPAFLRQQRLLYPSRRSEHLRLVKALRRGDLQPWDQLLQQARQQDSRALVSAEILSLVLAEPGDRTAGSLLSELLHWLSGQGIGLELVAFVRDQPTYLNSRYTQLLKRFYLASSFRRYVRQTLRRGGESNCDYLELFGEALDRPEVRCHFLPFRAGEADPNGGGQGQAGVGHPRPLARPPPLGEAGRRRHRQRQPTPRGQLATPALQLVRRIGQPLQGEAGAEQAGALQGAGQAGIEIPEALPVLPGQGVLSQQLGAEVELQQGMVQPLLLQGFPQQPRAGPQVGGRPLQPPLAQLLGQQVGQPPGHRPLQRGMLPVGAGPAPEALPHLGA